MTTKLLRLAAGTLALAMATVAFSAPPTLVQALAYAKSIVLVRRVVKDNQVHAYVKEVWRIAPDAGPPPAVGSEYGAPMRNNPNVQFPERDGVCFEFGSNHPEGLPNKLRIPVIEDGRIPAFDTTLDDLRAAVQTASKAATH